MGKAKDIKILITGGSGFIGAALCRKLILDGYDVVYVSREPSLDPLLKNKHLKGDISEYYSIADHFTGIDTVFHIAAKAGIVVHKKEYYMTNVTGTENVIRACKQTKVKNLVFTSSASVVFDGSDLSGLNETLPYPKKALSPYQESKIISEQLILKADSKSLRTISLRPHIVWGPGDTQIFARIISRYKSGKLILLKNRNPFIDTTYISNAVDAHICAMEALQLNPESAGKAYFISDNNPIRVQNFIKMLLKVAKDNKVIRYIPYKLALCISYMIQCTYRLAGIKSEPAVSPFIVKEIAYDHWFDISAATNILHYSPKINRASGLENLKSWFGEL